MKKIGWIFVVGIVLLAAFLLMRSPDEGALDKGALEEVVIPAVSQVSEPQVTVVPSPSPLRDASGRIPLPSPEVLTLSANVVSSPLYPLYGSHNIGGYVLRRRMVEAIDHELSADEVRTLLTFVCCRPEEVGLSDDDFNGVGDVVLLKLEEQKELHPEYTDHLVVMFYDESLNEIWRDYCIQHLGTVYQRASLEKRPVIRQLYEDAIKPGSSFAGTAMLSMKRSAGTSDLSEAFVAEKAMEVASSGAYGDAERLSALHVAATFDHPEAVKIAREIVVSKHSATFRAASLAVIGLNGDASDRPLLEKYVKSSDIRLRVAATEALKNLDQR